MSDVLKTELTGKVCLIAGASGTIGRAVAECFQERGARLALTYLAHQPRAGLRSEDHRDEKILQLPMDIRCRQQIECTVQRVLNHFGQIHVLVNCSGVIGPIGSTSTVSIEEWVSAFETNMIGSFYLTRAVLAPMLANSKGKIVHFSGGGAAYGRPFFTAYGASKAALVRFSESLAEELTGSNIDVNTIAPGPVNSRMWDQMRAAGEEGGTRTLEEIRKMEESGGVPAQRAAELAAFLASERSNGLTGRLISAVHDNWETFDRDIANLIHSEAGTLRRVPFV